MANNTIKPRWLPCSILAVLLLTVCSKGAVLQNSPYEPEPASIVRNGDTWTLRNRVLIAEVNYLNGSVRFTQLRNRQAGTDYISDQYSSPMFCFETGEGLITADDGMWSLKNSSIEDIKLYGITWGKRLELLITRTSPVHLSIKLNFEVYRDRAGIRHYAWIHNHQEEELEIRASDVLAFEVAARPEVIHYIEGKLNWRATSQGVDRAGRNCIAQYPGGHGWFVLPENNWATCLVPGGKKGTQEHKMMFIQACRDSSSVRVATDPKAIQLILFPGEEIEYFSVNLGVYTGDTRDGRVAASEHLRERFRFHDTSSFLSMNDYFWRNRRTDDNYRNIAIPRAKEAGFDHVHIDDFWYFPEDSCKPANNWTDMEALCALIRENGMKPGHWFSLQGKYCINGWGAGRDCADPANVDFKLKQCEEILIGRYKSTWDQVDAGLLWKTGETTSYSHPSDSVYRKILGMKRYMNTITQQYPDFTMQVTCEIDNPMQGHENENVGLIHLADNGMVGMYLRTDRKDNVQDLFDSIGLFPLEGLCASWGDMWLDSPNWYYQFLLARHNDIYSWPGGWSKESIARLGRFNAWRKSHRIGALLNMVVRPVYDGATSPYKGPWAWMFVNTDRSRGLLIAIDHKKTGVDGILPKLRWLDEHKSYLVEDISLHSDGFHYSFRGLCAGATLKSPGFPVNLSSYPDRCAAFWIQEAIPDRPQVLYADHRIANYSERTEGTSLKVEAEGAPNTRVQIVVYKPGAKDVENRTFPLDSEGRATVAFDPTTIEKSKTDPMPSVVYRPEQSKTP